MKPVTSSIHIRTGLPRFGLRHSNSRARYLGAKASRPVTMPVVDYWARWRHSTFHVTQPSHVTSPYSCTHSPLAFYPLIASMLPTHRHNPLSLLRLACDRCRRPSYDAMLSVACTRSQHASICQANHHTWTARQ